MHYREHLACLVGGFTTVLELGGFFESTYDAAHHKPSLDGEFAEHPLAPSHSTSPLPHRDPYSLLSFAPNSVFIFKQISSKRFFRN
jgi:hypothetical protein